MKLRKIRPINERFWASVEKTETCWLWRGGLDRRGYGIFYDTRRTVEGKRNWFAHRYSFTIIKGSIPEGLEIDHLCRVVNCVNPDHLEAVTHTVNVQRGMAVGPRSHCRNGHVFNEENTWRSPRGGQRFCLTCKRASNLEYWRENVRPNKPWLKTKPGLNEA